MAQKSSGGRRSPVYGKGNAWLDKNMKKDALKNSSRKAKKGNKGEGKKKK